MTEHPRYIDAATLSGVMMPLIVGGTAYPPLPIEPIEARAEFRAASTARPRPAPTPSQPASPGGPAYPTLPLEPDTRDGNGGERK